MNKLLLLLVFAFTGTFAQTDVVKFSAKIANKNSDSIVIESISKFRKVIYANEKGEFSDSFSVTPETHRLFDGAQYTFMYLKNGYDLTLTMDANQFDESIMYSGKGSKENNYFAQKALSDEKFRESMKIMDTAAFNKALETRAANLEKQLKDIDDAEFKERAKGTYKLEAEQMASMFEMAQAQRKLVGADSPQFDYENHKGGKTKLADLKGKYVYIDNWATWCGPCRAEIPSLKKIEERYLGENIEFVSISIDEQKDHEEWRKFVVDKNLGGIQLFADNNWSSKFIKDFEINSIPRFILIAPDGTIVDANAKRPSDPGLQEQLDKLLMSK